MPKNSQGIKHTATAFHGWYKAKEKIYSYARDFGQSKEMRFPLHFPIYMLLTGCDSNSALSGHGKKSISKLVKVKSSILNSISFTHHILNVWSLSCYYCQRKTYTVSNLASVTPEP